VEEAGRQEHKKPEQAEHETSLIHECGTEGNVQSICLIQMETTIWRATAI